MSSQRKVTSRLFGCPIIRHEYDDRVLVYTQSFKVCANITQGFIHPLQHRGVNRIKFVQARIHIFLMKPIVKSELAGMVRKRPGL